MRNKILFVLCAACLVFMVSTAEAAYQSRFDAINFVPAADAGNYFTVYGSRNLKSWQGHAGVYFDYANRPLEFRATVGAAGRQSVLDHTMIADFYGALGFTDWFSMGMNIPVIGYSWYYTDDVNALADHGPGMGDLMLNAKFRLVDIDKHHVGLSLVPYVTAPTGDVVRYSGNGNVTGGLNFVLDGKIHDRFEMALNVGYLLRDDVSRTYNFVNGSTSTIRVDDTITLGVAANIKATRLFQIIIESFMNTQALRNMFDTTNTTSWEAGAGMRYYFGDSGFAMSLGGNAGLIEGVGSPRFRVFSALAWTSPETRDCPPCAPDPRIKDNKIVIWGKIFFDTAKSTIKPISFPVLDDVVDVLRTHPEIQLVEVQGHCDWRGNDAYNMRLSQSRSESVREYLIKAGIDPSRLTAHGYGESRPIASNETVEGMSQNRRVEFVILQSSGGYTQTPNSADTTVTQQYLPVQNINDISPSLQDTTPALVKDTTVSEPEVVLEPVVETDPRFQPVPVIIKDTQPAPAEIIQEEIVEPVPPPAPETEYERVPVDEGTEEIPPM